jgi:hypothetical protein
VWVDNFQFVDLKSGENLLPEGDFEQDINELKMELDFSEFDIAARKYLDGLGFNGFRTRFSGLRSGLIWGKRQDGLTDLLMELPNTRSSQAFILKVSKIIWKLMDG